MPAAAMAALPSGHPLRRTMTVLPVRPPTPGISSLSLPRATARPLPLRLAISTASLDHPPLPRSTTATVIPRPHIRREMTPILLRRTSLEALPPRRAMAALPALSTPTTVDLDGSLGGRMWWNPLGLPDPRPPSNHRRMTTQIRCADGAVPPILDRIQSFLGGLVAERTTKKVVSGWRFILGFIVLVYAARRYFEKKQAAAPSTDPAGTNAKKTWDVVREETALILKFLKRVVVMKPDSKESSVTIRILSLVFNFLNFMWGVSNVLSALCGFSVACAVAVVMSLLGLKDEDGTKSSEDVYSKLIEIEAKLSSSPPPPPPPPPPAAGPTEQN